MVELLTFEKSSMPTAKVLSSNDLLRGQLVFYGNAFPEICGEKNTREREQNTLEKRVVWYVDLAAKSCRVHPLNFFAAE